LVEVLIVVAILSLIAGGVAIVAVPQWIKAQKDNAVIDARNLQQVTEAWRLNHPTASAECPTVDRLLSDKALPADKKVRDPWGNPFTIVCDADGYGVSSAGSDRQVGTDDDIAVGVACAKAKEAGHAQPIGCS
jgi:type II secretory pathway pseudopilin PulG